MAIDQNHPQADAWLRFLGVKEKPDTFQIYMDMNFPGEVEVTMYSRYTGKQKYRRDYAGLLGLKQQGPTRLATEACDEVDWDKVRDEVFMEIQ